jgi:type IV secretory pathway VirJ component
LRYYLKAWSRDDVVLIGYSFGADVLPFIVNRLPADLRGRIVSTSLLGPATHATFEVHVADWVPGIRKTGLPIAPELEQLAANRVLCIHGAGEDDSLCGDAAARGVAVVQIGSGHHFSGKYDQLTTRILHFSGEAARRPHA